MIAQFFGSPFTRPAGDRKTVGFWIRGRRALHRAGPQFLRWPSGAREGYAPRLRRQRCELGKIERTLFLLQYISSVELRRRIHVGLNKGEARNALARAVFFNRLGELHDRTHENQRHRASGLNLVVAAIVLWNTVYLERAVAAAAVISAASREPR